MLLDIIIKCEEDNVLYSDITDLVFFITNIDSGEAKQHSLQTTLFYIFKNYKWNALVEYLLITIVKKYNSSTVNSLLTILKQYIYKIDSENLNTLKDIFKNNKCILNILTQESSIRQLASNSTSSKIKGNYNGI